jgi:apolipoprotein N-acyltransferase
MFGSRIPLWLALLVSAAAGPILDAGFPGFSWWPMTFAGVALMLGVLINRGWAAGLLLGFISGLSFYLAHIEWTSTYLGPLPWIALSVAMSLFWAAAGLCIAVSYRWLPAVWPTWVGRIVLVPIVVAGLWSAREALTSVWPYGGFAWGRVALSQADSPFGQLAAWVCLSGLSYAIVSLVALIIQLAREGARGILLRAAVATGATCILLLVPAWPITTSGTSSIVGVQGNAKAGYFDTPRPGDVLRDQVNATVPVIGHRADLIVWPENGSDLDPLRNPRAEAELDYISGEMQAPVLFGTITQRDGELFNTSILWEGGGGAAAFYDKRHPVPFGEYIPDRSFWEPLAPDLLGLIEREYRPGTADNVIQVGSMRVGVAICYDIADDQLISEMIGGGAQVIIVQSNNADFGRTDENEQQLAIARMRAIQTGRSVVNVSTVGTSAIIASDGRIVDRIPAFQAGAMADDVTLAATITPASMAGRSIEWCVSLAGLAGFVFAFTAAIQARLRRNGLAVRRGLGPDLLFPSTRTQVGKSLL